MDLEDTRRIPPPDLDREPLKVNVYERMAKAAAELMPLFPYDSAGAIVPCGAVLTGGPDMEYGHFFHWNTVNEVVVTYGGNQAMLAPGQIMALQQLHGVNSFLRDEKDPEAFAVMVITQHQSTSGDQREAVLARCKKCKAELVRHSYDATPHGLPGYDAESYGADEDPIRHLEIRNELGLREGGFGIMLARGLVDDFRYNERGNEVTLVKYFDPQHRPRG